LIKKNDVIALLDENLVPVLPRLVGAIVSFITIPILIKNVGLEIFGIFSLFVAFRFVQAFADLGFANSLVGVLINNKFNVGQSEFKKLIVSLMKFNFVMALLFFLVFFVFDLSNLFEISDLYKLDFEVSFIIFIFGSIPFFTISIIQKVYISQEKYLLSSALVNGIYILSNFGIVIASFFSRPLPYMIAMLVVIPSISSLLLMIRMLRKFPNVQTSNLSSSDFRYSARSFLILQVSTSIATQIDAVMLGLFLSPIDVGIFSASSKVLSVILFFIVFSLTPIWTIVNNLILVKNRLGIIQYFRRTLQIYLSLAIVFSLAFFIFYDSINALVYDGIVEIPLSLKITFSVWIPIFVVWQIMGNFMNGLDQQNWLVKFYLVNTSANFILSYACLAFTKDLASTVAASCVTTCLFLILPMFVRFRAIINSLPHN